MAQSWTGDLIKVADMAARDLLHERLMALWAVLGLAALVTPLLIMFGLKHGIVASMKDRLIGSAINREIRPTDYRSYDAEWFRELAALPGVELVIPDTRLLAASIKLVNQANFDAEPVSATMRPTMPADPLLREWGAEMSGPRSVVLTTRVANALKAEQGSIIQGVIGRRRGTETVVLDLEVSSILPREVLDREWVYVGLPLLVATELYREEQEVTGMNIEGEFPDPDSVGWAYGSFRLFARTLEDVAPLVDWLESKGIPSTSQYAQISRIQQLDRALGMVFLIVVIVALLGGAASLGANLFAGVIRKRHELSLMRLIGFSGRAIVLFPIMQALVLAVLGSAVAIAAYAIAEPIINWQLGGAAMGLFVSRLSESAPICFLLPEHYLIAAGIVIGISMLAAIAGAARAGSISPAEGIRRD